MTDIIPTLLTSDPNQYRSLIESFNLFAKRVQIDIADGDFAPTTTIPTISVWWPRGWQVDLHMMVARPSQHLPALLKLQPSLVIFHAETGENLLPVFEQLKAANIKVGVALLKHTYPGDAKDLIAAADHALIFAGELGRQGGEADLLQAEKVPLIREIKPDIEIGWDGGANLTNIRALAHADINIINVGSAITSAPDQAAAYKALVAEADKRGVLL